MSREAAETIKEGLVSLGNNIFWGCIWICIGLVIAGSR